jgi:hypothetical protein
VRNTALLCTGFSNPLTKRRGTYGWVNAAEGRDLRADLLARLHNIAGHPKTRQAIRGHYSSPPWPGRPLTCGRVGFP